MLPTAHYRFVFHLLALLLLPSNGFVIYSTSFVGEVTNWLDNVNISWKSIEVPSTLTLPSKTIVEIQKNDKVDGPKVALHIIPTPKSLDEALAPTLTKWLTDFATNQTHDATTLSESTTTTEFPGRIIHLHQDVWLNKMDIVQARLQAQLGSTQRVFARKTISKRINATYAMEFLDAHHLWGSTRAKYYYGLVDKQGELVAVATFSSRRKVMRDGNPHRSNELLRYCAQRNMTVVGGITKLIKAFSREQTPDDIVTVVDRDWGDGSGWHSINFETVAVLPPVVMVVNPSELGVRRHLVGAGISSDDSDVKNKSSRRGLPEVVKNELHVCNSVSESQRCLSDHNFFPVYDSGVERLILLSNQQHGDVNDSGSAATRKLSGMELWNRSHPTYVTKFYSDSPGIVALLQEANQDHETDSEE